MKLFSTLSVALLLKMKCVKKIRLTKKQKKKDPVLPSRSRTHLNVIFEETGFILSTDRMQSLGKLQFDME